MKVYIIEHSFNKAWKLDNFHEILSVHSTEEKAEKELKTIAAKIEKGESTFFGKDRPKGEYSEDGKRITFPWVYAGEKMFTHFYITEKTLL